MTNSDLLRDSAAVISSTMPSAKYACSGSPERLAKGMTAMEGLLGNGSTGAFDVALGENAGAGSPPSSAAMLPMTFR